LAEVVGLAQEAATSFEEARRLAEDLEHGYISEVQMLVEVLDYAAKVSHCHVVQLLAKAGTPVFLRDALAGAEDLLERAATLHAGETPSRYIIDCQARLCSIYGNYGEALQSWDSLLSRAEVAKPPVRKQIVWTLLRRREGQWEQLTEREVARAQRLLEENLEEASNDPASLRLWLRAIRHSVRPPSLDSVIERVGYWKANTGTLDAVFYLYVLHALKALAGSGQALLDCERALEQCKNMTRYRRDRTWSLEWVGPEEGVKQLVHHSRLGQWATDFWTNTDVLVRVPGRISEIGGHHKGTVELGAGLKAFFVPGKAGLSSGRDENAAVLCYVAFMYDGPRAWDVQRA
jgi:hypothetical protein